MCVKLLLIIICNVKEFIDCNSSNMQIHNLIFWKEWLQFDFEFSIGNTNQYLSIQKYSCIKMSISEYDS